MNLFGLFGRSKPVSFEQFRDMVRQAVRRSAPHVTVEAHPNGFTLRWEGRMPVTCNLRNLYASYVRSPDQKDALIQNWLDSLITEVPEHTWVDARPTLRPMLRNLRYVEQARASLARVDPPDELPAQHFVGDLYVTVVREVGRTLTGVTRLQLETWEVDFETALHEALNNMGMMSFPQSGNALLSGTTARRKEAAAGEEVGLVFQGDHLTATWFLLERFRDHLALRLQSDYVVSVPNRNRLIAVRADEPGLVASVMQGNRNYERQPYPLTAQCFYVDVSATGGRVSVYQPGMHPLSSDPVVGPDRRGPVSVTPETPAPAVSRPGPIDLSKWGLTESTEDTVSEITPWNRGGAL